MLINDLSYLEVEAADVQGAGEAEALAAALASALGQTRVVTSTVTGTLASAFEGLKIAGSTSCSSAGAYT